jgi:hypothetical protein
VAWCEYTPNSKRPTEEKKLKKQDSRVLELRASAKRGKK